MKNLIQAAPTSRRSKGEHGGKRPGAGRKPLVPRTDPAPGTPEPETAEEYLELVVAGRLPADPSRVRAATALIRYQTTQKRAPLASPPPRELARSVTRAAETAIADEFETRAAEIRARYSSRRRTP